MLELLDQMVQKYIQTYKDLASTVNSIIAVYIAKCLNFMKPTVKLGAYWTWFLFVGKYFVKKNGFSAMFENNW